MYILTCHYAFIRDKSIYSSIIMHLYIKIDIYMSFFKHIYLFRITNSSLAPNVIIHLYVIKVYIQVSLCIYSNKCIYLSASMHLYVIKVYIHVS